LAVRADLTSRKLLKLSDLYREGALTPKEKALLRWSKQQGPKFTGKPIKGKPIKGATLRDIAQPTINPVNTKDLVRQGQKIAAKGSARYATKALQKGARLASKGLALLWGTPAVIGAELLISKDAGTDQYGRKIDTPEGYKSMQEDNAVADYYATYGSYPENYKPGDHNQNAIVDRVEAKLRSEIMAKQLRQQSGVQQTQPTPEEMARNKWRREVLTSVTGDWQEAREGHKPESYIGRGGG